MIKKNTPVFSLFGWCRGFLFEADIIKNCILMKVGTE